MGQKRIKTSVFLLLGLGISGLQAQQSINTIGGNSTGNDGTISWTVAQIAYQNISSSSGSIAEGVQQPYEISIVSETNDLEALGLSLTLYPNPTSNFLELNIEKNNVINLIYELYDLNGKLIEKKNITGNQTRINMSNLISSTYLVKVFKESKEVKTFKIIKN